MDGIAESGHFNLIGRRAEEVCAVRAGERLELPVPPFCFKQKTLQASRLTSPSRSECVRCGFARSPLCHVVRCAALICLRHGAEQKGVALFGEGAWSAQTHVALYPGRKRSALAHAQQEASRARAQV
ncbi:hypothetical protein SRHO_G00039340 [Serrasalmus rhombeus]